MSHIITAKVQVTDKGVFSEACSRLGYELEETSATHRLYGRNTAVGFKVRGVGLAYPVVLSEEKDGTYSLKYDTWNAKVDSPEELIRTLEHTYAAHQAQHDLEAAGIQCYVGETVTSDGKLCTEVSTYV